MLLRMLAGAVSANGGIHSIAELAFALGEPCHSTLEKGLGKRGQTPFPINSTDRFDIVCRKESRTGSNIPERVCKPKFLIEDSAANVSDFMFGGRALAADSAVISGTSAELELLQEEMAELICSNAQMREIAGILQLMRKRRAQL